MNTTGKVRCCLVMLFTVLLLSPAGAGAGWKQAVGPRVWKFPQDYGAHRDYKTEWWYFTGNLSDQSNSPYGYQLTFFRQGIRQNIDKPAGPWDIRDVYLGHFALADSGRKTFHYAERLSRSGPGLAGAAAGKLDVWLLDWSARMNGSAIRLKARQGEMELDLSLTRRKPPVLHGQQGLSRKGPREGQASYYTSLTHLETQGFLKTSSSKDRIAVRGRSWFDQEFGSNQLTAEQKGWDWFSIYLSDGRDIMIYLLRRKDGTIEPASSGTIVEKDGTAIHLTRTEFSVQVREHWKSPRSGGQYPSHWSIKIPASGIDLALTPRLADQELDTKGSTGVTYWEGAISGKGTSRSQAVICQGYAELTGYAGSLGSLF